MKQQFPSAHSSSTPATQRPSGLPSSTATFSVSLDHLTRPPSPSPSPSPSDDPWSGRQRPTTIYLGAKTSSTSPVSARFAPRLLLSSFSRLFPRINPATTRKSYRARAKDVLFPSQGTDPVATMFFPPRTRENSRKPVFFAPVKYYSSSPSSGCIH